jgi:hypothetical protein
MHVAALPNYDFLPAPLWLITVLHLLTLTLHFVAMNFMVGGIATLLFGKIENRWQNPVVQTFLKLFPTMMAATVTIGVAPLLFVQLTYGGLIYASSIVSGWFWFLIPFVVIVGYYFLYGASFAKKKTGRIGVWMFIALLCLVYVSLVYSSVFSMAERPDLQKELYAANQSGLAINTNVGEWIFRWLHMLTGALMVGAYFVGLLGRDDEQVFKAGRNFFVIGLILAAITGVAYLLTLGDALKPFMQSSGIYFMTIGALLSLGAGHTFIKKKFALTGILVFVSLATMVISRHVLRLVVLPEAARPDVLYADKVIPQWGVFGVFLVCFLVALGLVYYMLRLFVTDRAAEA